MKWFNNLRISTKLISSFVIVSIIGGLMGLYGYMNMNSVDKDYQNLYANYGISFGDLGSAGIDFNAMRVKLTNIVLITDREKMQQLRTEINELDEKIDANLGCILRLDPERRHQGVLCFVAGLAEAIQSGQG